MYKNNHIVISCITAIFVFVCTASQCQNITLCPQADSLKEKWAFVDCKTQTTVFPYVYKPVLKITNEYDSWGSDSWDENYSSYFWSKFATDSLIIVDSVGTVIFKVHKQSFPPIETINFCDNEFFNLLWLDSTQVNLYMAEFNMSKFLDKNGKEFKVKGIHNISITSIEKIGINYLVSFTNLPKEEYRQSRKYILTDSTGKPLSQAYDVMIFKKNMQLFHIQQEPKELSISRGKNKSRLSIKIKGRRFGFIDTQGNPIIPIKFRYYIYDNYANSFIILRKKNKYGVVDKKGKVILPFKYKALRQIDTTLFVAQDTDKINAEYVINSNQEILTKPVFYTISSLKNDTIYQKWNHTTLAYNADGKCISAKEIQEKKELFILFVKDTKTNKLYYLKNLYKVKSNEIELIFISPNHYQYQSQSVTLVARRWYNKPTVINKIDFSEIQAQRFKSISFSIQINQIKSINTQTAKEEILKGVWEYEFNKTE